jgi:hypothetical protein
VKSDIRANKILKYYYYYQIFYEWDELNLYGCVGSVHRSEVVSHRHRATEWGAARRSVSVTRADRTDALRTIRCSRKWVAGPILTSSTTETSDRSTFSCITRWTRVDMWWVLRKDHSSPAQRNLRSKCSHRHWTQDNESTCHGTLWFNDGHSRCTRKNTTRNIFTCKRKQRESIDIYR